MVQIITNSNGGGGGVGVYKYKGSVNSYEDLPTSGMKIGDVYNVVNEHTTAPAFPAGTNVAWTGTEWDALGGSIDFSEYQKKLVEGDGIDINQTTNEISVESAVISGAALGATAIQPNDNVSSLANDAGYVNKDVNDLTNYTKTSDLPDFTTYQLKSNMVTSLNSADDTHYPTAKAVKDAITSSGGGDVSGPSSSVDGHLAVFDGATGKVIKDGGAIPTPTTVVDNLTTQSATSALSANQGYVLDGKISTINGKIPSEATSSNKLADKQFVNDAINSVTAYYITKDAAGNQFATYAELAAATTFYSGGVVRTPTRNDYTIVLDDETHNDEVTRYIYNSGWEYQYTINESPLTQAQLDALNSGITSGKVTSYDSVVSTIAGYGNIVTHNTSEFATSAQGSKADSALQPNDNISELNNDAGYITGVNWGSVGGTLSNQVDLQNALNAKANDDAVVKLTGAQTIAGTKTFSTSPVVPSKTTDATNTGTSIATEAQVYKKQDTLVSGTNIKTVNSNSLLGCGNISLNEVPNGGTEGQVLTKTSSGCCWADVSGGGDNMFVDYILVGGGGGASLGGGGAGGLVFSRKKGISVGSYTVTVGAGGAGYTERTCEGEDGGNSSFLGEIAYGGGGGGACYTVNCGLGRPGGSGGGAAGDCRCYCRVPGGAGIYLQGNHGGAGCRDGNQYCGGGGGGAGGPGYKWGNYLESFQGKGGFPGLVHTPSGCNEYYSCGGFSAGGCVCYKDICYWYGDMCGGGGNGGGYCGKSINGQCGIVKIYYKSDGSCGFSNATGGTVTTEGDYKVHTFTSNGTFTIVS